MSLYEEKRHTLSDPVATCGDQLYVIGSQNGLFPDSWGGHVPGEMHGVWAHPIKLLDGYWFGVAQAAPAQTHWLAEAAACRAYPTYTEFDYLVGPLQITRRDFVPDGVPGVIVTLELRSAGRDTTPVDLTALFRSDLRPVWLGERTGMQDGPDHARVSGGRYVFTDSANPWCCIAAADRAPDSASAKSTFAGPQTCHAGTAQAHGVYRLLVPGGSQPLSIAFYIAGSSASLAEARATLEHLQRHHQTLFDQKHAAYQHMLETSAVATPDAGINRALQWTKINSQWLMREVPGAGRRGLGAGLPEYPWWFGIDTEYAVLPLLQSGQFELVRDTLLLLRRESEACNPNEPGRIAHEISTNGAIFNEGNAVESAAWVRSVHQYWQWTGDDAFLREQYSFCKAAVLEYLLGRCDADGDLCPSGRSIIETLEMHGGVEALDTAAYTHEALLRLLDMADFLGDAPAIPDLRAKADTLGRRIRTEWWLEEEGLFADMRASKNQVRAMLKRLDAEAAEADPYTPGGADFGRQVRMAHELLAPGLARHAGQPDDADLPWLLRHWVVMCPVETGLATQAQAKAVLARLQTDEFCNEHGMYLHPRRQDVMSINTGMLALSAGRAGAIADALRWVRTLSGQLSYRTPGAICEALPGAWCFVQLWSNVGVTSPVVECMLGVQPDAGRRTVRIVPNLPNDWSEAEVKQLRVGEARIDMRLQRAGPNGINIQVAGAEGYVLELGVTLEPGQTPERMLIDGRPVEWMIETSPAGRHALCRAPGGAITRFSVEVA